MRLYHPITAGQLLLSNYSATVNLRNVGLKELITDVLEEMLPTRTLTPPPSYGIMIAENDALEGSSIPSRTLNETEISCSPIPITFTEARMRLEVKKSGVAHHYFLKKN